MTNLLQETLAKLSEHGKTPADVKWVGSFDGEYANTWEEFAKIADVAYDNGYGGQEVNPDLVVVGTNWWLARGEYDGSEWWNFCAKPAKRLATKGFDSVVRDNHYDYPWVKVEETE